MSDTEHWKGKLIPTGKTPKEYDPSSDDIDDDYYEKAIVIDGLVYEIEKDEINVYDDIFNSTKNEDGTISFEVKYYNGSCGFNEAIEYALESD